MLKGTSVLIVCVLGLMASISACGNHSKNDTTSTTGHIKIENNGVNIAYTDTGTGDTTLLFVHGWCINKNYFASQLTAFAGKYRVIAIDLPGFGQSGKNRTSWTVADFGKDVATVINQLHLKNVVLIGHSMSGAIIVQAKLDAPDKVIGLIGIDNFKEDFTAPETKESKAEFAGFIGMLHKNFHKNVAYYFNQYLFSKTTDTLVRKRILNDVAQADSAVAIACMLDTGFNSSKKLKSANMKLHLINSDYFPNDTTALVKTGIPYQLLVIKGTGHFPMVEKPGEFNTLLQKALSEIKQ
jgi:pimeloyl-ACP methyl ester carboxylesterase